MALRETPERASKIGRNARAEQQATTCPHCRSILFGSESRCGECGKPVSLPPPARVVFDKWPLKRLHVRGHITRVQYHAGMRYYEHWYASGLSPIRGMDLGRSGGSSGDPNVGLPVSLAQAAHREAFRKGALHLGKEFAPYVDDIVLREIEPEEVGRKLTGREARPQARAVAIEFLKGGLDRLAQAYSLG